MRPPRPCSVPRCPHPAMERGRCHAHQLPVAETRRKAPEQRRFYGSTAWKRIRDVVLTQQPVCAICQSAPSTNVDHEDGDWTNNNRGNLRGLCDPCERSRTGRQHAAKRGQPAPPKPDPFWFA